MKLFDIHVHYTGNAAELDRCVGLWQGAGIEKAAIFAINAPDGSFAPLDAIAAAHAKHPDFVVPFGYLNPGRHDCVAEVDAAAARGFKGMKLIFPADRYDVDEYMPIYERAAKHKMVLLFHTGIVAFTGIGCQTTWRNSSRSMEPICLDRIARSFPDMTIIGAHLGTSGYYEVACAMMRWLPNVYLDLVIGQFHYVRRDMPEGPGALAIKPRIQELYDTGGLDLNKVLFGTDGFFGREGTKPDWSVRTVKFELDALGATDAEKAAVCWDTAARLFGM